MVVVWVGMMVRVIMTMTMTMTVIMIVMVPMFMILIGLGADALDVVVMACLRLADLVLEAQHLLAVFAQLAVHIVLAAQDILDPFGERVQHQRMVAEVLGFDELDPGMARGDALGCVVNPFHQNSGE